MKSIFFVAALGLSLSLPAFAQTAPPKRLTPKMQKVMDQALLQAYVHRVNRDVHTGKDIERELFPRISAKDRADMQPIFASINSLPKLSLDSDTIVFHFADGDVRVRWPNQKNGQLLFDGVSFVIDPTAPIKFQIDNFIAKMKEKRQKSHASFTFGLFPEAHAGALKTVWLACESARFCNTIAVASFGAVLATYGDTIKNGTYNTFCWAISGYKPWANGASGFCRQWKKEGDEWEKYVASQELKTDDADSEWVASDPQCPKNDKGEETFDAWMGETVKLPNGEWEARNSWEHFVGKSKDSNLTEGYLYSAGQPTDNPKAATMQFFFTKTDKPTLEAIRFPKEGSGEMVTIWSTDLQKDLPVEYRGKFTRMRNLAQAAQAWVKTCRTLARATKIRPRQTEQAIKIMQQQPDAPATSTSPAPTSK
jgi:hypothetical protein